MTLASWILHVQMCKNVIPEPLDDHFEHTVLPNPTDGVQQDVHFHEQGERHEAHLCCGFLQSDS